MRDACGGKLGQVPIWPTKSAYTRHKMTTSSASAKTKKATHPGSTLFNFLGPNERIPLDVLYTAQASHLLNGLGTEMSRVTAQSCFALARLTNGVLVSYTSEIGHGSSIETGTASADLVRVVQLGDMSMVCMYMVFSQVVVQDDNVRVLNEVGRSIGEIGAHG